MWNISVRMLYIKSCQYDGSDDIGLGSHRALVSRTDAHFGVRYRTQQITVNNYIDLESVVLSTWKRNIHSFVKKQVNQYEKQASLQS